VEDKTMGTRGAYGFRINGQDKVTYCHNDSYPNGLGNMIITFISKNSINKIGIAAESVILVNEEDKASPEQLAEVKRILEDDGEQRGDWYNALRKAQGELTPYIDGLVWMIDSNKFLNDSLFCEWAYIMNMDTGKLEIYKGFNLNKKAAGRYADTKGYKADENDKEAYYGVVLVKEIRFSDLPKKDDEITEFCKNLEKEFDDK
jgi:hypothetical protein